MTFKTIILLVMVISATAMGCQSATYVKAIDARASLASVDDAKAILPFMDRGRIDKLILAASTPEDVVQAVTVAYPERFVAMKRTTEICPSFCGLVDKPKELEKLLTASPKLYVDIAFDSTEALQSGLLKISKHPEALRQLMMRHPDRFLFASGLVIDSHNRDDEVAILGTFKGYRRLLEDAHYHFPKLSKLWEKRGMRLPHDGALHGLFLPKEVLQKIYKDNAEAILKR